MLENYGRYWLLELWRRFCSWVSSLPTEQFLQDVSCFLKEVPGNIYIFLKDDVLEGIVLAWLLRRRAEWVALGKGVSGFFLLLLSIKYD